MISMAMQFIIINLNKIESAEYTVHVYDNVFMQIRERVIIL